jgi:acyl carrier protein
MKNSMTKDDIFKNISAYLVEYFDIPADDITLEAKIYEDLDLDSIDAVDLIVKLQDLTGEKISPESFREVRTVGDVVNKVAELTEKK